MRRLALRMQLSNAVLQSSVFATRASKLRTNISLKRILRDGAPVAVPDARGLSTCDHVVLAVRDAADRIERGQ
jgi:hypothetical protein